VTLIAGKAGRSAIRERLLKGGVRRNEPLAEIVVDRVPSFLHVTSSLDVQNAHSVQTEDKR
jgi:hypothetical protein